AYVTIGVHTQANDVSQAVSQNANQVSSVMAALADRGVAQADMQTSNFSLYTGQNYDNLGQALGIQYTVDNTVNVIVRDLPSMGELLDAAISAGANSIYGVSFDLDDKTQAQSDARDMAVANAISEAKSLAAAAGVTLGDIVSINYTNNSSNTYYPQYGMGGGGGAEASTSIVPGLISVSADVNITYSIK
ncbi:MAG TPA: SIMPL domain-containing protein, partial [Pseudodesulfovibrio sp.]|nr:SIMPL domain-containing protein [Pseudodesulfovibrio sp.]